ncbi:MAG TPA: hypothetical protein VHX37_05055 [Acidobacteriaceae bacterium]|nr:hypothetical protein [Acidobacteriaceae bacterium]
MKKTWSVRRTMVAALTAGLFSFAAAEGQIVSPPPNPQLPPPAPLAGVRYDYPWEIYGGFAYSHFDAGPNLLQGSNLGGFDARVVRELGTRWGVGANVRGYYGTSGAAPNCGSCSGSGPNAGPIEGPFVSEHMFLGGPEYRLARNEHAALMLHAFVGGAYGDFTRGLNGVPPANVGFFSNQFTTAMAMGGSVDLNRSPRLVFRIAPDATLTDFGHNGFAEQFAISVGVVYRMGHRFKTK